MNWFVSNSNVRVTEADDRCPHLNDGDKAFHRTAEMDSFGPVGRYCMCEQCYKDTYMAKKVEGGNFILEAVRAAAKARVGRYDSPSDEEKEFLRVLATADIVGIQLRKEVIPPEEWDTRGRERVEYRPVFKAIINGLLPVELACKDTVWSWGWDCEFLNRLGENLMQLTQRVVFDDARGLYQLSPHIGYLVGASRIYDFDGNAVSDYHWTDKKPESFEMRPLGDYDICGCYDCKQPKFKYQVTEWKWYDFYAPQGDEPLVICDTCWDAPKHKERRRKDQADYNREMGHDDPDEGYDYGPDEEPEIFDESDVIVVEAPTMVVREELAVLRFKSAEELSVSLEAATEYLQRRQDDLTKLKVMLWDNQNVIAPGWELRRYTDGSICVCSLVGDDVDWALSFHTIEQALAYILARWW